jgi:hypothetical protein
VPGRRGGLCHSLNEAATPVVTQFAFTAHRAFRHQPYPFRRLDRPC